MVNYLNQKGLTYESYIIGVTLGDKKGPLQSLQPITSSLPKTWHVLMTNMLMNNTIKIEINHEIL